jgi:hypothetical protein
VTCTNPQGDINNSELELASSVAQYAILAQELNVIEATIHNSSDNVSDNVAMVWWQRKGAPHQVAPRLVYSVSRHSTNSTTAKCRLSITYPRKKMPWKMHAAACNELHLG